MKARSELNAAFARFKELADRKREIFDEDLQALVSYESVTGRSDGALQVSSRWRQHSETGELPVAAHRVHRRWRRGARRVQRLRPGGCHRSRPSSRTSNSGAELVLYSVNAITGYRSQGEVTVRLQAAGRGGQRRGCRYRHHGGLCQGLSECAEQITE